MNIGTSIRRFLLKTKNLVLKNAIKPVFEGAFRFFNDSGLKAAIRAQAEKHPFVEINLRKIHLKLIDFHLNQARTLKIRENAKGKILFVDVTLLILEDFKTGIQRVARSILMQLLENPPSGYVIQPIYSERHSGYKLAKANLGGDGELNLTWEGADDIIAVSGGDIFLGLDFVCMPTLIETPYLQIIRQQGVKVYFVVYDLLPVQFPAYFPPVSNKFHEKWLKTIAKFDGVICISKTVADEYRVWAASKRITLDSQFKLSYFHLGADLDKSSPSKGLPPDAPEMLSAFAEKTTFLLVGTIEPRKGYGQMIEAFSALWSQGVDVNLVIVGKVGWNIDSLVQTISTHKELGKHLYWLQGITDEYLERIYASSACLIAASEAEGFGLPIIEAAKHGIPVIARDIPVFREVAGDAAFYFSDKSQSTISDQILDWMGLQKTNSHPKSTEIQYINWQQSAEQLKKALFN
jgi:glycosyltransferase involved in cell wall biosynthesis